MCFFLFVTIFVSRHASNSAVVKVGPTPNDVKLLRARLVVSVDDLAW